MKVIIALFSLVFFTSFFINNSLELSVKKKRDSKTVGVKVQKYKKVTVCEIKKNPSDYNHQLIEVSGFLSISFENFTLNDLDCDSEQGIWLEYGGVSSSGTIICCDVVAKRSRPKPLVVEKIPVPLIDDEKFRELDMFLQKNGDTNIKATIRGRFFTGEKMKFPSGNEGWTGYGHFGMYSLFAIEQVVSFEKNSNPLLDYSNTVLDHEFNGKCTGYNHFEFNEDSIELQKKADAGERPWSYDDPQRVAAEGLALRLSINSKKIKGLQKSKEKQGQIAYSWKQKDNKKEYWIVVNRPYYLSFYAKNPTKVVWSVTEAFEIYSCD